MTNKERTKEVERICDKINNYAKERSAEVTALENEIKRLKKETENTLNLMIDFECKKKGVSVELVKIILKDVYK